MNSFRESDFSHPNIFVLTPQNLYKSQILKHTFTNNAIADSVLVTIRLFVLVILLKDIIVRFVYMRPRRGTEGDTITYFSQARIVLLDNSFLLRWAWRGCRPVDASYVHRRTNWQYNIVMLATFILFKSRLV